MIKIEFYVGLSKDRHDNDIGDATAMDGLAAVDAILRATYGGYTSQAAFGVYKDQSTEETAVFTIFVGEPTGKPFLFEDTKEIAGKLAAALNQESVLWFVSGGSGGFQGR